MVAYNLKEIDDRLQQLHQFDQATRYSKQKDSLQKELCGFLAALPGHVTLATVTPRDLCRFLVFKDKAGKTQVHRMSCAHLGQRGHHVCGCPLRLSYKTVDSYIGKLRSIFHALGRDGEWDRRLGLGNPAADKSVKDYLRLITAEQLQARITPKQATPFFVDELTRLSCFLENELQKAKTSIQRFIIARDQAYLKTAFFSGDRPGDLGQLKVPEILRFPNDDGFLFNHVWGKTLRDGDENVFGIRRNPNITICPPYKGQTSMQTEIPSSWFRFDQFSELSPTNQRYNKFADNKTLGQNLPYAESSAVKHTQDQPQQTTCSSSILESMVRTMERISISQEIPSIKVRKFSGNPEEFPRFRQRFQQLVESKPLEESVKMATLLQFLEGPPLKAVLPYETIPGGLNKALKVLQERFGQPYQIVRACIERLTKGPVINYNDREGLQAFADIVESTCEILKSMDCVQEVTTDHLEKIILKLPKSMQNSFGEYLHKIGKGGWIMPKLEDVVNFLKNKACAANHPFFSSTHLDSTAAKYLRPKPATQVSTLTTSGLSTCSNSDNQVLRSSTTANQESRRCSMCSESHPLYCCETFKSKPLKERCEYVMKKGLCLNCISSRRHLCRDCPSASRCKVCEKKHHSLLHDYSKRQNIDNTNSANQNNIVSSGHVSALLQVQPIVVIGQNKSITTYALIDSGSDTTMIDESLALSLGIEGPQQSLFINTVAQRNVKGKAARVNFQISSVDPNEVSLVQVPTAWSVKDLNIPLRHTSSMIQDLPHLQSIPFPDVERPKISALLGTSVPEAFVPIDVKRGLPSQPFAIQTVLGWSILGRNSDVQSATLSVNFINQEEPNLNESLRKFWEIDSSGIEKPTTKPMSIEDVNAMKIIQETLSKVGGHYQMGMLWRDRNVHLPYNKPLAEARLCHLRNRLKKDPKLKIKYKAVIDDYVAKGYARKLTKEEATTTSNITWYLPHHPVLNPNKPGKVRVVFDAAAKYQGTSLNDQLVQGPDLTNNLVGVLIRFREERIALTSDVESMFHQTRVTPKDTDALRFLWWTNDIDEPPEEYKMLVHIFGAKSSPCCANKTLKQIADDNEEIYDAKAIDTLRRNFYVDDELKSVPSEEDAVHLADQLIRLTKEGSYNLTKFMSNSRNVLSSIPKERLAKPDLDLEFDELPFERTLGLRWSPETDCFYFKGVNTSKPTTKRGIVSVVSSLYDPLGFLSPFVLLAKIIIQDLWKIKCAWDEQVQEPYATQWRNWKEMLTRLNRIAIPRCYKAFVTQDIVSTQLHFFSDASKKGLAASCYIRMVNSVGFIYIAFVIGKSRNVPTKELSVPRLELQAAVMSARLCALVTKELDLPVDETFLWTDSMTTIQYVKNTKRRFRPFVSYRVAEIHELTSMDQWNYVPGASNPADGGSRGMKIDEFNLDCSWWRGPSFLYYPNDYWPSVKVNEVPDNDKEVAKPKISVMSVSAESSLDRLLSRCSSWLHLQRSIAWLLRFIRFLRKDNPPTGHLTLQEMREATKVIARLLQRKFFSDELLSLKNGRPVKGRSKMANLNPILNEGLIRVGGRASLAPLSYDSKHPIVLPKDHPVTSSIVRFYHEAYGHAGREHVLSLIRQLFWIIQGRSLVRSLLSRCIVCRKLNESTMRQIMADLPKERLIPYEPPFTFTGVDLFGPFSVKRGRTTQKIYGCLFVCFTCRAVHIEDVSSLETDTFINALRRFISNRGFPKQIWSDNGTNFVGTERELRQAVREWNHEKIVLELHKKGVDWFSCPYPEWRFQPPAASHMSGVWERLVRSVKKAMKGVFGNPNALVNHETLRTVFADVVTILNSRPLCPASQDPKDLEPLTPSHLLLQRPTLAIPPGIFCERDLYSKKQWRRAQFLASCFWSRWIREYIPLLQTRQKWLCTRRNLQLNDLVLVTDQNLPRGRWLLGRVNKIFPGPDGKVRSAEIKTKNSSLVRPIVKLCLLEEAC